MAIEIGRRGFITGLISFVAAPAIVRYSNIMPVKAMSVPVPVLLGGGWMGYQDVGNWFSGENSGFFDWVERVKAGNA